MTMNVKEEGKNREKESEKMDAKNQSHWWWFDSHNSSNCSPWLQSTLAELNEKTKTMLMLVEDDADSFAQRAEMYYKKRPELISLVEDFYRAHRSLAEKFDQQKSDRSIRVKSPLGHSLSLPTDDYENGFETAFSVKSFDCFPYSCDESAESEVDDPEFEDDSQVDQVKDSKEIPFTASVANDEITKLREELDRLQKENEIQKNQIKATYQEKEKLDNQLADIISELKKLRENSEAIKEEKRLEMTKMDDEMRSLRLENMKLSELVNKKDEEGIVAAKKFEEAKQNVMKIEEENRYLKEKLKHDEEEKNLSMMSLRLENMKLRELVNTKDEERIEAAKKFEEAQQEVMKIDEENRYLKEKLKHDEEEEIRVKTLFEEAKVELVNAYTKKVWVKEEQLKHEEAEKVEAKRKVEKTTRELTKLREEIVKKDECLMKALAEKDEEKRAVIRQLTLAMEILREDNKLLEKTIANDASKKRRPSQWSRLFSSSSKCHASVVVPLKLMGPY